MSRSPTIRRRIVDERGRLKRVVRTLAGHVMPGEPSEIRIDGFEQVIRGGLITSADVVQQPGDVFSLRGHWCCSEI